MGVRRIRNIIISTGISIVIWHPSRYAIVHYTKTGGATHLFMTLIFVTAENPRDGLQVERTGAQSGVPCFGAFLRVLIWTEGGLRLR